MILLDELIGEFSSLFAAQQNWQPWEITECLKEIIRLKLKTLGCDYQVANEVAIHKTAVIETGVVLNSPVIVGPHGFIGAHAYFREGVFLDHSVKIGPGCEIKSSIISAGTAIAHFNYVGNSIIGRNVNFEAGSIVANHYNERENKRISVLFRGKVIDTGVNKFGSVVGDGSRIGANAVLSPGTILERNTIVKRLELVEQHTINNK